MSMAGYTKLFNSILASTIWREDNITRIVWITLLAMADKNGIAEGSVPGLADFARVSVDDTRKALEKLSSPDEDSRSQEHDGRRIEAVDGGWQLLNHAKYRAKLNADERREYNRIKKAEERQKKSATVKRVNDSSALSAHTEAEADTKAEATTTPPASQHGVGLILSPKDYARLQETHAFIGQCLRIPKVLHAELVAKSGTASDAALRSWYQTLDAELEQSGKGTGDVFAWLRPRHQAFAVEQGWIDAAPKAGKPQVKHRSMVQILAEEQAKWAKK